MLSSPQRMGFNVDSPSNLDMIPGRTLVATGSDGFTLEIALKLGEASRLAAA
jgi:hypothetical protein